MRRNKLIYAWMLPTVVAVSFAFGPSDPISLPEPTVPKVSDSHKRFLSRVARRTIRDSILDRAPYQLEYVPSVLADMEAEVVVRLRRHGYLLATAAAGPAPPATAVRDAALTAVRNLARGQAVDVDLDLANNLLIELEVVGAPQAIRVEGDWTEPRVIDPYIEPGVHGLSLVGPRAQHRFCPSELFTTDQVFSDALKRWAQMTHATTEQLGDVRLTRFRTVHWYEPPGDDVIVSLHRGLTVVPMRAVSAEGLDDAIEKLAAYMTYRQHESGLFAYQYEPGRDRYSDDQNVVRQVGAVAAMAMHARWSGQSASRAAADLGIRFHLQGLMEVPEVNDAAFIATADKENKLGVTALLALAMALHPEASSYDELRTKLINGMLQLQRPSGMFLTAFPPAVGITSQDYFPGEALLAMAAQYDHQPDAEILDSFDRAISFYRDYFRESPSPAFVPWQVQAYALMARHSKREDYVRYVYELTDWLAERQLDESNCNWPELWGGIAAYQPGRVGVATAAYLEGFADALQVARVDGDADRVRRYTDVVRRAARFVMQLQFRPEEAYFVHSPRDVVGGIRTSPSLNLLRIDHGQHGLIALIKARQALFPERG